MNITLISVSMNSKFTGASRKVDRSQGKLIEPRFHEQKMTDSSGPDAANSALQVS